LKTGDMFSPIGKYFDSNNLVYNTKRDIPRGVPHHLHLITDEKYEKGDWVVHGLVDLYYQVDDDNMEASLHNKCRKIVATTDPKLWENAYVRKAVSQVKGGAFVTGIGIAKIPSSFIEEYVKNPSRRCLLKPMM